MGRVQLTKAQEAFSTPFEFLVSNDEDLKAVGMNKTVIEERRKALKGEG